MTPIKIPKAQALRLRFNRVDQRPLEEDICAENNFAFFDYNVAPLPRAEKPDF